MPHASNQPAPALDVVADRNGVQYVDRSGLKWVKDPAGHWHPYVKQPVTARVLIALWLILLAITVVGNIVIWNLL